MSACHHIWASYHELAEAPQVREAGDAVAGCGVGGNVVPEHSAVIALLTHIHYLVRSLVGEGRGVI